DAGRVLVHRWLGPRGHLATRVIRKPCRIPLPLFCRRGTRERAGDLRQSSFSPASHVGSDPARGAGADPNAGHLARAACQCTKYRSSMMHVAQVADPVPSVEASAGRLDDSRELRGSKIAEPHRSYRGALAVVLFLCVTAGIGYRTVTRLNVPGVPHSGGTGLQDFRDTFYYPVVSFLEGNNPYDPSSHVRTYPVGNTFPLYLPLTLVLHLPFGLLSFTTAELVYFLVTAAFMPLLAYLSLRLCRVGVSIGSVFGLASLMLLSRPGEWNLFLGQCAATMGIATCAAFYFRGRRSWLAALGVAVASMKPTFGIPLAVLMLAKREIRTVLTGLLIAGGISLGAAVILVHNAGGLVPFWASLGASQLDFGADPQVNPATSSYRIDAVAFVARFLGHPLGLMGELGILMGILGARALAVSRPQRVQDGAARLLSASLICVAVLTCTYHQTYDLLLLALPLTAVATVRWSVLTSGNAGVRLILLASLAVPAFNYLVSDSILGRV